MIHAVAVGEVVGCEIGEEVKEARVDGGYGDGLAVGGALEVENCTEGFEIEVWGWGVVAF